MHRILQSGLAIGAGAAVAFGATGCGPSFGESSSSEAYPAPASLSPATTSAAGKVAVSTMQHENKSGKAYETSVVYNDGTAQVTENVYEGSHTLVLNLGCVAGEGVLVTSGIGDKENLTPRDLAGVNYMLKFLMAGTKVGSGICDGGVIEPSENPTIFKMIDDINIVNRK